MDELREDELFKRPRAGDIRTAWRDLVADPLVSLARLRGAALSKAGIGEDGPDGGVVLRSVYWRFFHGLFPTPTSPALFPASLESARTTHTSLRRRWLIAPDGRWASDCSSYPTDTFTGPFSPSSPNVSTPNSFSAPTSSPAPAPAPAPAPTWSSTSTPPPPPHAAAAAAAAAAAPGPGWDPLSLETSSPWKTWFAHQDLRATIRQDVERTFPDIPYFRIERVRVMLTTGLFLYSVCHPDVGYRQGMHELLAVCLLVVDRDSLECAELPSENGSRVRDEVDEAMRAALDRRFVEHDAFQLFAEIMRGAKAFYEWRGEEGPRVKNSVAPPAPVIVRCQALHNSLLRRVDPQLWERFETEGLEPQIWAIRWIRLIFTRELPFHLAMRVWDGLFAEDPGLGMLDHICVAMLLLIRNELVNADYSTLLTSLLRYPSPSVEYPFAPHLILSQAILLRGNVSPAGGVEVVVQNQELLGVPAAPARPAEEAAVPQRGARRAGGPRPLMLGQGHGQGHAQVPTQRGVQGIAAGLFERAQAAGLDKTLLATVADLRKNLPDASTAYSYLPNLAFSPAGAQTADRGFSSIPSSAALPQRSGFFSQPHPPPRSATPASAPPVTAPPLVRQESMDSNLSIKSLRDAEREVAELRLAMMGMGKAMSAWLAALEPSLPPAATAGSEWSGLGRVRDTLLDAAGSEVDEVVRQWGWHEGLEAAGSGAATPTGSGRSEVGGDADGDSDSFGEVSGDAIRIGVLGSSQRHEREGAALAGPPVPVGAGGPAEDETETETPRVRQQGTLGHLAVPVQRPESAQIQVDRPAERPVAAPQVPLAAIRAPSHYPPTPTASAIPPIEARPRTPLSERLSAAAKPRTVSGTSSMLGPGAPGEASAGLGAQDADPLAGLGVGLGVGVGSGPMQGSGALAAKRGWGRGATYDPLGAGA